MVVRDNYGAYFVSQYNATLSVNINSEYKDIDVPDAGKDKTGSNMFRKIGEAIGNGISAAWKGISDFLNKPFGMLMGVAAIAVIGIGGVIVITGLKSKGGVHANN